MEFCKRLRISRFFMIYRIIVSILKNPDKSCPEDLENHL